MPITPHRAVALTLVERYIQNLQRIYANTHTEDDISGRSMSQLLEEAENAIKRSVNAGPDGRIISIGSGATGAIDKFQQIIGVALPPATRQVLNRMMKDALGAETHEQFTDYLDSINRWFSSVRTNTTPMRLPGARAWPAYRSQTQR